MIVEFSVTNFRSFKERCTLSWEAEGRLKSGRGRLVKTSMGIKLLPSIGVFGPNAGGKSNLIKGLFLLRQKVLGLEPFDTPNPFSKHPEASPFLLDNKSRQQPIKLEIVLWSEADRQEYGYSLEIKGNQIVGEGLSVRAKPGDRFGRQRDIFRRRQKAADQPQFDFDPRSKPRLGKLTQFVTSEQPAVYVFAKFADPLSAAFLQLIGHMTVVVGNYDSQLMPRAVDLFKRQPPKARERIKEIIRRADLAILDTNLVESTIPYGEAHPKHRRIMTAQRGGGPNPREVRYQGFSTTHRLYGAENSTVEFSLINQESAGTNKIFFLTALIVDILEAGGVAVIDDIGSEIHPLMTRALVELFDNRETNPKGAQLLYNSHETLLLSEDVNLRRDQIWFADKDQHEATKLICLSEYKVRDDYRIDRNYLVGRFGAIPNLDFSEPDDDG